MASPTTTTSELERRASHDRRRSERRWEGIPVEIDRRSGTERRTDDRRNVLVAALRAVDVPPILKNYSAPLLRFFGFVATSLTGITAVLTLIGFLAERSHLAMLGFTSVPLDLHRYMFTGARLIASLPVVVIIAVIATPLGWATLLGGVAVYTSRFVPWLRVRFIGLGQMVFPRYRALMLLLLVGFQLFVLYQLSSITRVSNLLFTEDGPALVQSAAFLFTEASLRSWILYENEGALQVLAGSLLLLPVISGGFLWMAIAARPSASDMKNRTGERALSGTNVVLFCVQLFFLPIVLGVLQLPNTFPRVEIDRQNAGIVQMAIPSTGRLWLIHSEDDVYYLYSRIAARIWAVPEQNVLPLTFRGRASVFVEDIDAAVQSVDVANDRVTLANGTIIDQVNGWTIDTIGLDLARAADSAANGRILWAKGAGWVRTIKPLTMVGAHILLSIPDSTMSVRSRNQGGV